MTVDLANLIERLEAATGPDRELDILIGYAVDLHGDDKHLAFRMSFDTCGMDMMLRMAESYQNIWRTELPRYTSSIDSAMTLVPEGCGFGMDTAVDGEAYSFASIKRNGVPIGWPRNHSGRTPALALCIAALKARIQSGGGNG